MKKKVSASVEDSLADINKVLQRNISLKYAFMQGMVRGIGTALGATVIVAIITSLTIHFAGSLETDAIFKSILDSMSE